MKAKTVEEPIPQAKANSVWVQDAWASPSEHHTGL